jgi:hypothetical protein
LRRGLGECLLGAGIELTRVGRDLLQLLSSEPDAGYVKTLGLLYDTKGWVLRPEKD